MRGVLLILFMMNFGLIVQAQQLHDLQSEQRATKAKIALIAAELHGVNSSQRSATEKLSLLKSRIAERDKVIRNIDAQISILESRSASQTDVVSIQSARLSLLRSTYRATIRTLYSSYSTGGFRSLLLSSSSRDQIVRRAHFSRIFMSAIRTQSLSIESTQRELGVELAVITMQKQELSDLRSQGAQELQTINDERREVERLSVSLKKNASTLMAQQTAERKALDALQRAIQHTVADEVSGSGGTSTKNAPLSGEFAAARSRLISPINRAKIVDTYGIHPHPSEKGVKVDNRGVNLQSTAGASVRVVFEGEVRRVFMVPGMGRSVLVRHGEYLTVYSSMDAVSVGAGDKIAGGATIGTVGESGILHFEIWRENQTLNPSSWVRF